MRLLRTRRHRRVWRTRALSSWTRKEACSDCFDSCSSAWPLKTFADCFCHRSGFGFWRHVKEATDQEIVSIGYLKRFDRIAGQRGRNESINRGGDKMSEHRIYDPVTSFSQ